MTNPSSSARDSIGAEAAAWCFELRQPNAGAATRTEFMRWLRGSPIHVEEYLRACGTDRMLRDAALAPTHSVEDVLDSIRDDSRIRLLPGATRPAPARRRRGRVLWAAAAAIVAAIALLAVVQHPSVPPAATYATTPGETRSWSLADGSTLTLDSSSEVAVRLGARERHVAVVRGRVFFKVAKAVDRPFRVTAGSGDIVAVGTRFDVERRSPSVLVRVAEGRVAMYAHSIPGPGPAASAADLVLAPGQAALLTAQGISPPVAVPVSVIEAWSQGQLVFDDKPISEVTTEANRYLPVPVVIDDAGLGMRRISGSLAMGDTDSLLAFLRASADVVVERSPARIRVHRRGHALATPAKPGAVHRVPQS